MVRRIGGACLGAYNIGFLVCFLIFTLYVGFFPAQNKFQLYLPIIPILIGAIALVAVTLHLANRAKLPAKIRKFQPYLLPLAFGGLLAIQIVTAMALESSGYTWDNQIVFNQAGNYALTGAIDPGQVKYFADHPNNIPLLSALGAYFRFLHHFKFNDFLTASVLLDVALMWLTQIMIYLVAKNLYGRKIAALSLIFSFALITLSMHVQTVYTDTLAIVFPITLLYLSLRLIKSKRLPVKILLSGFLGIITIIGSLIKPTVGIASIAILIVAFLWLTITKTRRPIAARVGLMLGCIITVLLSMSLAYVAYLKGVDGLAILPFPAANANEHGIPPAHYAAIGLKTHYLSNTTEYGGYDKEESEVATSLPTQQQRADYSYASIKHELPGYGFVGYLNFLVHKANWILSDATFYAYGEGSNANVVFAHHDGLSSFIRNFMYANGDFYMLFANILQVFWLAILLLIATQIIFVLTNKTARTNLYMTIPRLMITGILLFLLIFEGRSRYILLYLPIFIVLALYTVKVFDEEH